MNKNAPVNSNPSGALVGKVEKTVTFTFKIQGENEDEVRNHELNLQGDITNLMMLYRDDVTWI